MTDKECWKECEYAKPKSEIISAYLVMKKENEQLKKQLTESKKIIKDLLWSERHRCTGEEFLEIRSKAEIFIMREV